MNDQSFSSLGLSPAILSALSKQGYEKPTPIQSETIPSLLEGRDLLGCAQTGTGKTAAFALPIIQLLSASPDRPQSRGCRALIVSPTRELAAQIDANVAAYSVGSKLSHACVFGGVGKNPQIKALSRGVDILIATPGRLLDLQGEGQLRLDGVGIFVLDEADRMLDMGFIHDVRKVISLLPRQRQTLLFSATMPSDIASLANSILKNPIRVTVTPDKPAVELIDQKVAFVQKAEKRGYLTSLIRSQSVYRAIVFTRTKHGADRLAKALSSSDIPAEAIHANKSQNNRLRTMEGFRSGSIQVLVATDLAARGIDVDGVSHVYNYELPDVPETYVHRIGRTARAGATGQAIALCDSEEKPLLKAIERLLKKSVPVASGEIFEQAAVDGKAGAIADAAAKANRPNFLTKNENHGRSDSRKSGSGRDQGKHRPAGSQRAEGGRRQDASRKDSRGNSSFAKAERSTSGGQRQKDAGRPTQSSSRPAPRAGQHEAGRAALPAVRRPQTSRTIVDKQADSEQSRGSRVSIDEVTGRMTSRR